MRGREEEEKKRFEKQIESWREETKQGKAKQTSPRGSGGGGGTAANIGGNVSRHYPADEQFSSG